MVMRGHFSNMLVVCFLAASTCCWASQENTILVPRRDINMVGKRNPTARSPVGFNRDNKSQGSSNDCMRLIANLRGGSLGPIDHFLRNHPYAAAFSVCAIKAAAADSIAQKLERSSAQHSNSDQIEKVDFQYKRNLAFICYGGLYQGCFQEYLYNELFSRLFGLDNRPITVFKKVLFDTVIIAPLICLPIAYIIKAIVFKQSLRKGLQRYVYDVTNHGLLTKKTLFWAPINAVAFKVVPEHMRITFIACFSFFWLILMSSISGKSG